MFNKFYSFMLNNVELEIKNDSFIYSQAIEYNKFFQAQFGLLKIIFLKIFFIRLGICFTENN